MKPRDNEKRYSKNDLKRMAVRRYMGFSIVGYVLLFVCFSSLHFPNPPSFVSEVFSFHTSQTHHTRTKHDTKQAFCAGIIALSIILAQDKTVTPAGTHVCFPCTFFPTPQLTHANNPFSNHPPTLTNAPLPSPFTHTPRLTTGKKGPGTSARRLQLLQSTCRRGSG